MVGFLADRVGGGVLLTIAANLTGNPEQQIFKSWKDAIEYCDKQNPRVQVFNRETADAFVKAGK